MSKELVSKGAIRQIIANLDNDNTHAIIVELLMIYIEALDKAMKIVKDGGKDAGN